MERTLILACNDRLSAALPAGFNPDLGNVLKENR